MSLTKNNLFKKNVFEKPCDIRPKIALAGNPNVGKSTLFNLLTGSNQHTGNWPGKTVTGATGIAKHNKKEYVFADLPGTYSLLAHSAEEEAARDYICFENPDAVVVVCDATALERSLNLALQCLEICPKTLVCVNLTDEAEKKGIEIDLKKLSEFLKAPAVGISARKNKGINRLWSELDKLLKSPEKDFFEIKYNSDLQSAALILSKSFSKSLPKYINPKWAALRLLEENGSNETYSNLKSGLCKASGENFFDEDNLKQAVLKLEEKGIFQNRITDLITKSIILNAEEAANLAVKTKKTQNMHCGRIADKILTGRFTGIPLMLVMLLFLFWLTLYAANTPSDLLFGLFSKFEVIFYNLLTYFKLPNFFKDITVFGIYRVLTWVVSVMLPPMAVFFPLFTFWEDLGYLPRIAFNLDGIFKKCGACGKQALTMCMGFGCNAAGVVGCRIIDSPREKLIAVLTNAFVPCNGKFPMLISIITAFFTLNLVSPLNSAVGALLLTACVCLGTGATFFASHLLGKTLLKGTPSSFVLELPPYRRPQLLKIIIRSIFDRTRFVLLRAAAVAAPAGAVIWLLANFCIKERSALCIISDFLNPFASFFGLDGTILLAFILGIPANEIVIPLMIMIYTSSGTLAQTGGTEAIRQVLLSNGWNTLTALNMLIFSVMHWPCSTTLITIKKETGAFKYAFAAFILPTTLGLLLCFFTKLVYGLFV